MNSGRRILVVEDERSIGEMLKTVLEAQGFVIDIAIDGAKAKELIRGRKYDLYFMDIRLPVFSGMDLYEWMLEKYPSLARRVAFTTGSVIGEETKLFIKKVQRPTLFKPFTLKELREFIASSFEAIDEEQCVGKAASYTGE